MCPPDHYGIEYEINPWMSRNRQADPAAAREQWDTLHGILRERLGLDVSLLEPAEGLPDLVFTANAGVARGGVFIPSNFRHPERRREAPVYLDWFRKHGFEIRPVRADLHFEGEGDLLKMGEDWFAGSGFRTSRRALLPLREILSERVISLGLNDPRYYHLDTCFCPLDAESLLWYPPAFDRPSRRIVGRLPLLRIEPPPEEAARFACNAVVVGKDVVMNTGCGRTKGALEKAGYRVLEAEMSEFIKAGGAAKCLVLFVD